MAVYDDLINNNTLTQEQKIAAIKARGEAERKAIDKNLQSSYGRIGLGALLEGASLHPIFNIPYVGTGIGGAMFEAGNAIMEGKSGADIAKDAGKGFAIGEAAGAIPYVGKVAGKTKVGQGAKTQAGNLFNYLANTKAGQKVAEIAPKVEDVLMTDIKAFNPFKQTQTAYHGSPYEFNKFKNEAIGTGEGAQAHGYGHYAAKSKDVAEGYRRNLSKKDTLYEEYKTLTQYIDFLNGLKEKAGLSEGLENALQKSKTELSNLMNTYKPEEYLNNVNNGQLYKLSIPKDDVMLREDLLLSQQPKFVQQAFKDEIASFKKGLKKELQSNIDAKNILLKSLQNAKAKGSDRLIYTIEKDIERNLPVYDTKIWQLQDQLNQNIPAAMNKTGGTIYNDLGENASNILGNKGIKGISYNGGIDGEARVIFNPDDIEIVRKYYNQPSLYEKITNSTPNTGALSTNLYDLMTREEKIQNLWDKRKVWGTPFQKASGNPDLAIETLKNAQRGFVPNADNNGVDFVWGKYIPPTKPNKKGGGYGLAHIEGRRFEDGYNGTDFLETIPNLMQNGTEFYKEGHPGRYYKELGNQEAIIRTDYNGLPWHWLNSAYFKELDQ